MTTSTNLNVVRRYSQAAKVKFKHLLRPRDVCIKELDQLFEKIRQLKNGERPVLLKGKSVVLLLGKPSIKPQLAFVKAAQEFGMRWNIVFDNRKRVKTAVVEDTGRLLSKVADIVVCQLATHIRTINLSKHSEVPIVNIHNCRNSMLHVLSDLFTVQEHFSSLKGLTLAWLGPTGPLVNSYLSFAPRLGIHVKFHCCCISGEMMSPACLDITTNKELIKECVSWEEAVTNVDIIATRNHVIKKLKIHKKDVQYANKGWVFLHPLPRGIRDVDQEIFYGDNNLCWKSFENVPWVMGALMLHCFGDCGEKN